MSDTIPVAFNELPHRENLRIPKGNSVLRQWEIQIDTGIAEALPLTNATLTLTVSTAPGGTALLSGVEISNFSGASGIKVSGSSNEYLDMFIKAADTTTLGVGAFWYEVQAVFASDDANLPYQTKDLIVGTLVVTATAVA